MCSRVYMFDFSQIFYNIVLIKYKKQIYFKFFLEHGRE